MAQFEFLKALYKEGEGRRESCKIFGLFGGWWVKEIRSKINPNYNAAYRDSEYLGNKDMWELGTAVLWDCDSKILIKRWTWISEKDSTRMMNFSIISK